MNENPNGTPGPINPTPATPPAPEPVGPVTTTPISPAAPVGPTAPTPSGPIATGPAAPTTSTIVDSLAPTDRPMEAVTPEIVPEKKSKTGLIVGIIAIVAVLLIGGIAAALLLTTNKTDPVSSAMSKIMSGDTPSNVVVDGTIDVSIGDSSPVSKIKIALDSEIITSSAVNNSTAKVTATITGIGDLSFEFDEVYAGNGDLYFKIDGVMDALQKSGLLYMLNLSNKMSTPVDCGADGFCESEEIQEMTCEEGVECETLQIDYTENSVLDGGQSMFNVGTISYFTSLSDAIEFVDGEWIKISLDELNVISGGLTHNSSISCITDLVSNINTKSSSAAELYQKYPFVTSTNKDVSLASKQYPVYQVSIDSENFANYINSIKNSEMASDLYSCLNLNNNVSVSKDDIQKIAEEMPPIYTEVDNTNNFTRLYLSSQPDNSSASITIDLNFSYPNTINVPEPEEYQNFSTIRELLSGIYSI